MNIHEFGKKGSKIVVLIHPSVVMWDYFENVIPLMEKDYHLIVPALPGYDPDKKDDFTSVESIALELEKYLINHSLENIASIYGCSMGGSIILRILANNRLKIKSALIDGGITPYRLPWLFTRFIAIKDFLMIYMGKLGGMKILQRAFSTDELTEEDLKYVEKVLKMMSAKTIWRTFDSCNNYSMPPTVKTDCEHIEYWYSAVEEKARKWDIAYMHKVFPQAEFNRFTEVGHGGLAVLKPELLVRELERLCSQS